MISKFEEINLVDTGLLPPLVSNYLKGEERLTPLYKYKPALASFGQVIADKKNDTIDRSLLVQVLNEQYANMATTAQVTANINALAEPTTFTVVAAHQPCLFLGPLYNVIKIACAINLTRQLAATYPGYKFVPVFWLGSEDHDIEELNHVTIGGKLYEWKEPVSGAVGRIDSAVMKELLPDLMEQLGAAHPVVGMLQNGLEQFNTFGSFTQYLANELFKEEGLVVLDQDHPKFKRRFTQVITDELLHSRASSLLQHNVAFLEQHYKAQAKPRDINFFYLGEGFRERIIKNESGYSINNREIQFSKEEIVSEIAQNPERFSPNVILRPLYQEMLLPNLAFVGGAGELSYWLELKPVMDYYKVNFPMLVMRNSAFIVPANFTGKLQRAELSLLQLMGDTEKLLAQRAKEKAGNDISLAEEKKAVDALFESIVAKAEATDATLKQSALGEKQKALNALETLEGKMLKAEKRKLETFQNQVQALKSTLFPSGNLQERVEGFVAFYEPDFIATLAQQLNPLDFSLKGFVQNPAM